MSVARLPNGQEPRLLLQTLGTGCTCWGPEKCWALRVYLPPKQSVSRLAMSQDSTFTSSKQNHLSEEAGQPSFGRACKMSSTAS